MSYDIDLLDPITKEIIEINDAHFLRGGTYKIGGSKELSLNFSTCIFKFNNRKDLIWNL